MSIYGLLTVTALNRGLSIRRPRASTIFVFLLIGAVILSAATITYPRGIAAGKKTKVQRVEEAYILSTYQSQPDKILSEIAPGSARDAGVGAKLIRERGSVLQRLGYNVFSEPQPYRPLLTRPRH